MRQLHYGHHLSQLQYLACLERCLRPGTASGRSDLMTVMQISRTQPRGPAWDHGDQARERIDKKCRNQKAGNDLRAFRWGTVADHPYLIYLHPTLWLANKASESGRSFDSHQPSSKGNDRGTMACSFAKIRVRQDAERSLRDAGAPREEISLPLSISLA